MAVATGLLLGMAFGAPVARALPAYAQQTGLSCARCHVNAQGGGERTAFGKAFAHNGHRLPGSGSHATNRPSASPSRSSAAARDNNYEMGPGMMGGRDGMGPGMMWDSASGR